MRMLETVFDQSWCDFRGMWLERWVKADLALEVTLRNYGILRDILPNPAESTCIGEGEIDRGVMRCAIGFVYH